MQNIILPQAIKSLIATDDNGKPIVNFTSAMPYIKAVVRHLQDTRQNLSTADLVDFLFASLGITTDDGDLATALFYSLTADYVNDDDDDDDDYAVLYRVIINWLLEQRFETATYSRYLCILNADYPMQSTLNPTKIAVWRNTSKMGNWDKRQAVSVRKWIGSTLQGLTAEQAESLAKTIDNAIAPPQVLDIRHHDSYDIDGWTRAYVNDAIKSCMNPNHTSCEVGTKHTYRTYCSGHYGLPDNGLSLTVLYQDDKPVARAITFAYGEQNCYIRSYGDDRLKKWLQTNGYEQSDFMCGTILYTDERLMKPYVDGYEVHYADRHTTSDGKPYWELCTDGEYNLQTTNAYAVQMTACECCSGRFDDDELSEYQSAVNGDWYLVCEDCYHENRYWVYNGSRHTEPVFFHDGYAPDSNSYYVSYDGEYYHEDSLSDYDLRLIDGEVYHIDDLYYCEITDEYFTREEVYLDGDEISTTQPVYFPYECVSREYWDNNVVECACGTLALEQDTKILSMPSLGEVITLDIYWGVVHTKNARNDLVLELIFNLDIIERDYNYAPTEQMQAFMDYAIAYNKIQYLRFQELGI